MAAALARKLKKKCQGKNAKGRKKKEKIELKMGYNALNASCYKP